MTTATSPRVASTPPCDSNLMAEITGEANNLDAAVCDTEFFEKLPRAVTAAVIDEE
jgi:hypothetical protein